MTKENLRDLKKLVYNAADSAEGYVCWKLLDCVINGLNSKPDPVAEYIFGTSEDNFWTIAYFDNSAGNVKDALNKFFKAERIVDATVYGTSIIIWFVQKHHCAAVLNYVFNFIKEG